MHEAAEKKKDPSHEFRGPEAAMASWTGVWHSLRYYLLPASTARTRRG